MGAFDGAKPLKYSGLICGNDADMLLPTAQYRFVKFSDPNTVVLCDTQGERAAGVLQFPPKAVGDPVEVVYGGETFVQFSDDISPVGGLPIATDGVGRAASAAGILAFQLGMCVTLEGASGAGQLATAVVQCVNPPSIDNS
jgi:hypothetical protein